jgi:hypothetical protein
MTISTYSELQTALDNWLDRTNVTARSKEFISLFEAHFKRKAFGIRRGEQRDTNATISTEYEPLPDDCLSIVSLKINSSPVSSCKLVTTDWIDENYRNAETDVPRFYAIVGTEIRFAPAPASTYTAEIVYRTFDKLSDSNTSNWLLTGHEDIYLYGSLAAAEPFYMNDSRMVMWKALRDEGIADLIKAEKSAKWGNGARVRPDVGAGA